MASLTARLEDTNVHGRLVDIAQQQAALNTIQMLTPTMVQPAPSDVKTQPMAAHTFIHQQCDTRRAMIAALEAEITAFHAVHNDIFSITNNLPPEILAEVFSHLRNHPRSRPTPDFANAMAVCKRWRDVGCGVARFWTSIPLHNRSLLVVSLERSQRLPLTVYLADRNIADVGAVVDLLAPHMGRIKAVDISHPDKALLETLCSSFDRPAPQLQVLRIQYSQIGGDVFTLDPPFGGNMPALHSLALDRVLLSTPGAWMARLQEMSMRDTLPSLEHMLALLDRCMSLQTLTVDGYHTWSDEEDDQTYSAVFLPCLQLLDVRTQPIIETELLFACLHLPNTTAVRLEVDMHTDNMRPILLPELRPADIPCVRGLKRVDIQWQGSDSIAIRGFHNAQASKRSRPDFEVVITGATNFGDIPDEWCLDLSGVELLVIHQGGADEWSVWMWHFLEKFANITLLRFIEPDATSLVNLITAMSATIPSNPNVLEYCPHIHTLEVFDCQWAHENADKMGPMMAKRQTLDPRALQQVDMYYVKEGYLAQVRCTRGDGQGVVLTDIA